MFNLLLILERGLIELKPEYFVSLCRFLWFDTIYKYCIYGVDSYNYHSGKRRRIQVHLILKGFIVFYWMDKSRSFPMFILGYSVFLDLDISIAYSVDFFSYNFNILTFRSWLYILKFSESYIWMAFRPSSSLTLMERYESYYNYTHIFNKLFLILMINVPFYHSISDNLPMCLAYSYPKVRFDKWCHQKILIYLTMKCAESRLFSKCWNIHFVYRKV